MHVQAGTVDLTREFRHPVASVFAAWASAEAQLEWGDPGDGWSLAFDRFAFTVGERDTCRFGPAGGPQLVNDVDYLVIETDRRIVCSTCLRGAQGLSFAGTLAVTFSTAEAGTRLRLVEHGLYFDRMDDVEGHRSGWEGMLDGLARYLDQHATGALPNRPGLP